MFETGVFGHSMDCQWQAERRVNMLAIVQGGSLPVVWEFSWGRKVESMVEVFELPVLVYSFLHYLHA